MRSIRKSNEAVEKMTQSNQSNLLEIDNLRVSFRMEHNKVFDAVKGISFVIPTNKTVALVGESGSGKSVSAMAILGLLPEVSSIVGKDSVVNYQGRNLLTASQADLQKLRGKDISVIFQEPMTSLNPVFTVGDQISEVLRLHLNMSRSQARARSEALLGEVGIPDPKLRMK